MRYIIHQWTFFLPQIELYYVPDTSEDELAAAIEKARRTFQGMIRRKELKEKVWMEPPLSHLERNYARL